MIILVYFKSHTYNYSVNDQRALISPKLETRIIILRQRGLVYVHLNKTTIFTKKAINSLQDYNLSVADGIEKGRSSNMYNVQQSREGLWGLQ